MSQFAVSAVTASSVVSILVGALFAGWTTAPVLDRIATWQWNVFGGISAALIGAGATLVTKSRGRSVFAVSVGLLAGIIWLDYWLPNDVVSVRPSLAGVLSLVGLFRWDLVLFLGSACLGAILGGRLAIPSRPPQPTSGKIGVE